MIFVIASLELQSGTREAFLAEFDKVLEHVLTENGCIEYVPAVDAETGIGSQFKIGPDRVTIIEKWASVDALMAHDSAPHMQAFRARVKEYVRGREILILTPA